MVEYLALPGWKTPPRTVDDWVVALSESGGPVIVSRESSETWLEVAPIRLRGYVVVENGHAAAINFEIHDDHEPGPATRAIEEAATALGWEVHADDDDDDESDPDDDDD